MTPRKRDKVVQSASRVFVAVTVGWCLITCSLIFCLDQDVYGQLMFEVLMMFMSLAFPFFTVAVILEVFKAWDTSEARLAARAQEQSVSIIRQTIRDRDSIHTQQIDLNRRRHDRRR